MQVHHAYGLSPLTLHYAVALVDTVARTGVTPHGVGPTVSLTVGTLQMCACWPQPPTPSPIA